MKKVVAGLGFIFCGGIFYVSAFMVGVLNVSSTGEWLTSLGRFWIFLCTTLALQTCKW